MPPLFPSWMDVHRVDVKLDKLLELNHIVLNREAFLIQQEHEIMTTAQDIDDASKQILAKATAESDRITAIAGVVADIKAQNATLLQELADAQASGNQAAIDEAMANLKAANDKLDSNALAEAALTGTTPPAGTGTTAPPPTPNPLSIVTLDPSVGPESGGTSIAITGTGFVAADSVTVGGAAALNVVVNGPTSITATTPAGTGDADVLVNDGNGNSSNPGTFRYAPTP